jgi:hypothetical protein
MASSPRPFCADTSREAGEPLGATASRVDHWLLVEYPGRWARDAVAGSLIPSEAKEHLRGALAGLAHGRLLFIRRPDRRAAKERRVYLVRSGGARAEAFRRTVTDGAGLAGIDPAAMLAGDAERVDHPLLLVCAHGRRDRCCARYGAAVFTRACEHAGTEVVWQCTHVGGDRFAGNLVCLPEGLYFGHLDPDSTGRVLAEYAAGRIEPGHYRGRSCHSFPQQAAERAVRETTGIWEVDAVRFESWRRVAAHVWLVRFAAGGDDYDVRVTRADGEPMLLTCEATVPQRPRHYPAELV